MKLAGFNAISQADFLVTVTGGPGDTYTNTEYWSKFSGIKESAKRARYTVGEDNREYVAQTGTLSIEDCTLSKPFDPISDADLVSWIENKLLTGDYFQALIRPVKRTNEMQSIGNRTLRLINCRMMSRTFPSVDTGAGDQVAMLEITFSVERAPFAGPGAGAVTGRAIGDAI